HPSYGRNIAAALATSSATIATRATRVRRNDRSSHHNDGTSTPTITASPRPLSGRPSNHPSTCDGQARASASSSDHHSVTAAPQLPVRRAVRPRAGSPAPPDEGRPTRQTSHGY